jgi:hypothetical protein
MLVPNESHERENALRTYRREDAARHAVRARERRTNLSAANVSFLRSLGFVVRNEYGPRYPKYRR